jgi:hypothetical protein
MRNQSDSALPIGGICRKFAMKHAAIRTFCTAKFAGSKIFCAAQSIGCRCPERYTRILKGRARSPSGAPSTFVLVLSSQQGRHLPWTLP